MYFLSMGVKRSVNVQEGFREKVQHPLYYIVLTWWVDERSACRIPHTCKLQHRWNKSGRSTRPRSILARSFWVSERHWSRRRTYYSLRCLALVRCSARAESENRESKQKYLALVYTTQVNSAFRTIWLVPQSRNIKCIHLPSCGFRRKEMARETRFIRKWNNSLGTAIKLVSVNSGGYFPSRYPPLFTSTLVNG